MTQLSPSVQLTTAIPRRRSRLAAPLWWLMLLSCLGVAAYATRYFLAAPADDHFARYILPLRLHIIGGMGALLAGPWQFSERLRERALNVHRWLGRIYLLSVGVGSVAGLAMATVSEEGLPTHLGFGALAVLWLVGAAGEYRGAPPLDDPQFCINSRGDYSPELPAVDAVRFALVISLGLHYGVVAVLDSKSARCGMASAAERKSRTELGEADGLARATRRRAPRCSSPASRVGGTSALLPAPR